jgi:hypothetical protein
MIAFSIPPYPSFTSTEPNELPILFVPNVPFILKVVDGNVGICKKIQQRMMQKNLPKLKKKSELREFSKVSGANLGSNPDQFFVNGKLTPPTEVKIDKSALNLGGLDAFERALLQSIFETQKPYIEIAKIVIGLFVELEDIVAHVLGFGGPSKKPRGNRRALGFQGTQKGFKKDGTGGAGAGMNSLGKIGKKPAPKNKMSDNKFSPENIASQSTAEESTSPYTGKYIAITISTVYSTEEFDPSVEYTYKYVDLFEEFNPIVDDESTAIEEDEEPEKNQTIVLGVYNQDYEPLWYSQVQERLPWLVDKYVAGGPWPQIKPGESFDYLYVKKLFGIIVASRVGGPPEDDPNTIWIDESAGWEILRYEGNGPTIDIEGSRKFLKEGQLAVAYNSEKTQSLFQYYKNYYMEYTDIRLQKAFGNTASTYTDEDGTVKDSRQEARKDLESKFSDLSQAGMIPMQLEGLISNNFMSVSRTNTTNLINTEKFRNIAFAFKAKKIGNVWYDIESEYDMKIIKCDITFDITFLENVGERERKAKILRFIKKSYSVRLLNQKRINYIIYTSEGNFFNMNQTSLTLDYIRKDGVDRAIIVEDPRSGDSGYVLSNSQFPIRIADAEISTNLTNYWNYETNKRAYFKPNGDTYKLTFEYKGSGATAAWIDDSSSNIVNYSPFYREFLQGTIGGAVRPQQGGTMILFQINFKNEKVLINQNGNFYGILKTPNLSQFIPSEGQITTVDLNVESGQVTLASREAKPNLIRILDTDGGQNIPKIITGLGPQANIRNQQLYGSGPIGKEPYGSPIISSEPGESRNQTVEQIYRYPRTEDDIQTYYIVEAVLKTKNKNVLISVNEENDLKAKGGNGQRSGGGGGGIYLCCSIEAIPICLVGIIKKFVRIVIKIAAKLIPAITTFINLIKNPPQAISDIIIAKLGDDFGTDVPKFGFFSKPFLDQLRKVKKYAEDLKNAQGDPEKKQDIKDELKLYLNTSLLKNYVFISDKGQGRFVLDGSATINLFGDAPLLKNLPSLVFGIETNLGSLISPDPKPPFKLIFGLNRTKSGSQRKLPDLLGNMSDNMSKDIKEASLYNANFTPVLTFKNVIPAEAGGIPSIEETSTVYSTGTFKEDVLYEYFYLSDQVNDLVREAIKLEEQGDDTSLGKALGKLEDALRIDPKNGFVKGKIENLRKLRKNFSTQPIFDFILNLVMLPLKVIFGIITYIMNFFKSLANPFSLPGKIIDFVSFKWILDFFSPISPNSMFSMAGILFDIQKFFTEWLPVLAFPNPPKIPGAPDLPNPFSFMTFDLNEIIKLPWTTWPTYSYKEFKAITFLKFPLPIMILNAILCFIEAVINTFIDFVWAVLGLIEPETGKWIVLKPPYLNICKDTNADLSPKDIAKLLNLNPIDINTGPSASTEGIAFNPSLNDKGNEDSFKFVYFIKTSDGRDLRDLNQQEMEKWIENNSDLQYTFNFNI